jgi:formate dehydrogenase subunit delta
MSAGDRIATLVMMANQIAKFFDSQPGETAPLHIAEHLTAFWEPTMRRRLVEHADSGGDGLSASALSAARLLKTKSSEGLERALDALGESAPARGHGSDAG